MFCGNCGAQLPDGTRFCGNCGAEQTVQIDEEPFRQAPRMQAGPYTTESEHSDPVTQENAVPKEPLTADRTAQDPVVPEEEYWDDFTEEDAAEPVTQEPVRQTPPAQEPVRQTGTPSGNASRASIPPVDPAPRVGEYRKKFSIGNWLVLAGIIGGIAACVIAVLPYMEYFAALDEWFGSDGWSLFFEVFQESTTFTLLIVLAFILAFVLLFDLCRVNVATLIFCIPYVLISLINPGGFLTTYLYGVSLLYIGAVDYSVTFVVCWAVMVISAIVAFAGSIAAVAINHSRFKKHEKAREKWIAYRNYLKAMGEKIPEA